MATQPNAPPTNASRNTRLELTWIGKENRPRLEPRILLEDADKSYHAAERVTDHDIFDNRLIFGDNLLALKALEQEFTGKVKCIYIDPPYNTGSAFQSYDDGLEHSTWLSLMRDRLDILWRLLTEDGVLLISINDDEAHYLKVLCDELFTRTAFAATLVWNYEGNTDNQAKIINYHEYILVYSKSGQLDDLRVIDPNIKADSKLYRPEIRNTVVKNGPKNPQSDIKLPVGFPSSAPDGVLATAAIRFPKYSGDIEIRNGALTTEIVATSGWSSKEILESFISSRFAPVLDSKGQKTVFEITRSGAIEAVKVREQRKGHFTSVLRGFGTTNQMRLLLEEMGLRFDYPKPTGLLAYLIRAFSGPKDLILDSFAGSGTTGHAVMQVNREDDSERRFILIEVHEQNADSVIVPRLRHVIDGFTKAEIPVHGGGFRYYRLAPSLLELDRFGNHVISREYNAAMLAEAMCKLMAFRYEPSEEIYWQQGRSTETDFLYTTTQTLSRQQLEALSEEVGPNRSLLICCSAFRGKAADFANLTLRKIPMAVLARCEWGKDDYSLNVANLPKAPEPKGTDLPEPESESAHADTPPASPADARKRRGKTSAGQNSLDLFASSVGQVTA